MITLWHNCKRERQRERAREIVRERERERERKRDWGREGVGQGMQILTNSESQASHHVLFIHGTCSKHTCTWYLHKHGSDLD